MLVRKICEDFKKANQSHVFQFFDTLTKEEQKKLLEQAKLINLEHIQKFYFQSKQAYKINSCSARNLETPPYIRLPKKDKDFKLWKQAYFKGEEILKNGRVAVVTVAGGQGTRLGFQGPKGAYKITPIKNKSLFQVFAEKIISAIHRYNKPIHWFIMTSEINHKATLTFFKKNIFFGFNKKNIHFLKQGLIPAIDFNGKIILSNRGSIAMSPGGHGGIFRTLVNSGAIKTMNLLKIDTLSYFQVDNPLVQCIDPAFIGFHHQYRSEMSSKMIIKDYAEEKVGIFVIQDGKLTIREYSDLSNNLLLKKTNNGKIYFSAGNPAIHILDCSFVQNLGKFYFNRLPYHKINKKIKTIDKLGNHFNPKRANGIKFEQFVFDALSIARNPIIVQVSRENEFSPIKNINGKDSLKTCRNSQLKKHESWLRSVGYKVEVDKEGVPILPIEISPRFADTKDHFLEAWHKLKKKPSIQSDLLYFE